MEPVFELNHGPSFSTDSSLSSTNLLAQQQFSTLLVFQRLSTILTIPQQWLPIILILLLCGLMLFFIIKVCFLNPCPVYLVDFWCLKPPDSCRVSFSLFLEHASKIECFDSECITFMAKILSSSGQSEETYLPPALHCIPPKTNHQEAIREAQMLLFPIENLLSKTKVSPRDIDILIVNCSGFCPSPSLSSIIINKYSMRDDIKSYNLSGMGCSAGAISIDLAHSLMKIHRNVYALVLSTEILSTGWYSGHEKPKLLLNCLFRMGSAAILLTNKKQAKISSKYKLLSTVRTQRCFDEKAYLSAFSEEDSDGKLGVTLERDLLQVAGETLRQNIKILGSQILPPFERLKHDVSIIRKRFIHKSGEIYVPDFKAVIQHFCLPTSGGPVIREIAKGLKLGEREVEAALMTLHRFGNQSSSSLWYELAYLEAKERVKKGDQVWQLGMGSGPKSCSLVWECLRPIFPESNKGPWADCVHRYPISSQNLRT